MGHKYIAKHINLFKTYLKKYVVRASASEYSDSLLSRGDLCKFLQRKKTLAPGQETMRRRKTW